MSLVKTCQQGNNVSSEVVPLTSVYSLPVSPSCLKPLNIFYGIQQVSSVVSENEYIFHPCVTAALLCHTAFLFWY